jgi:hypothetical protein
VGSTSVFGRVIYVFLWCGVLCFLEIPMLSTVWCPNISTIWVTRCMSYKRHDLFTSTWVKSRFVECHVLLVICLFCLCFLCHRVVSCVPNVFCVSGLSISDYSIITWYFSYWPSYKSEACCIGLRRSRTPIQQTEDLLLGQYEKHHVMIPLLINQSNISRDFSLQLSKCLADSDLHVVVIGLTGIGPIRKISVLDWVLPYWPNESFYIVLTDLII